MGGSHRSAGVSPTTYSNVAGAGTGRRGGGVFGRKNKKMREAVGKSVKERELTMKLYLCQVTVLCFRLVTRNAWEQKHRLYQCKIGLKDACIHVVHICTHTHIHTFDYTLKSALDSFIFGTRTLMTGVLDTFYLLDVFLFGLTI